MFKFSLSKASAVVGGSASALAVVWYFKNPKITFGSPYDHKISRQILSKNQNNIDLDITLFQYQTCPFCCKVRTYLDYNDADYKMVEVHGVSKRELAWSEYKKVPVAVIKQGEEFVQINDSSLIISVLESYKSGTEKSLSKIAEFYPPFDTVDHKGAKKIDFYNKYNIMSGDSSTDENTDKLEVKWRQWVDETFVHTLSPNIYRTPSEALEAFKYVSKVGEWEKNFGYIETQSLIYVGAFVMYFVGKILKRRYNLDDDVRQSLFEQTKTWIMALESKNFLGGSKPNLADLAVYGVLNSIEGCTTFKDLMHENVHMQSWYLRTKSAIYKSRQADVAH